MSTRDVTALAIGLFERYGKTGVGIPYTYAKGGSTPTLDSLKAVINMKDAKGNYMYRSYYPASYGMGATGTGKRMALADVLKAPWSCDCIYWIRILCLYDRQVNPLPWPSNGYSIPQTPGGPRKNYYTAAGMDISAHGAYANFGAKPISTIPEPTPTKAVCVFWKLNNGKCPHIGLYIGNGKVLEQTPIKLQMTNLKDRDWGYWGYLPDKWRDFIEKTVGLGDKMDVTIPGYTTMKPAVVLPQLPILKPKTPEPASQPAPAPIVTPTSGNSYEETALEVWRGQGGWGNMPNRQKKLESAGYNYFAVQALVNALDKSNGRSFI